MFGSAVPSVRSRRLDELDPQERLELVRARPAGLAGCWGFLVAGAGSATLLFLVTSGFHPITDAPALVVVLFVSAVVIPMTLGIAMERRRFRQAGRALGLDAEQIARAERNLARGPLLLRGLTVDEALAEMARVMMIDGPRTPQGPHR